MTPTDKVLVTGISGFLGSHVALALLDRGYAVRGSLRDMTRAEHVRRDLADAGADTARLEFCPLDLMEDHGWTEAAHGCRYLIHVASPFTLAMPKDANELITPAVGGTRRAISAALAQGHDRIVLTSSVAAMDGGHARYDQPVTEQCWTPVDGRDVNAYCQSKILAEQAAWTLVEAQSARGRLAVINPGTMLGPLLSNDPGTSVSVIQRMMAGKMPMIPDLILPYVDVRDVAEGHVAALTAPDAGGARHMICNDGTSLWDIADMLGGIPGAAPQAPMRRLPSWLARIVAMFDPSLRDSRAWLGVKRRYDARNGVRLLGNPLRTTTDALADTARSLIDRQLISSRV